MHPDKNGSQIIMTYKMHMYYYSLSKLTNKKLTGTESNFNPMFVIVTKTFFTTYSIKGKKVKII